MALPGPDHLPYSHYGAPASVLAMPLIALGSLYDDASLSTSQFLFSLTSPILGALTALILFLFYIELELTLKQAFTWTMVSSFTTLLWPASSSAFDNAQHAFFALASVYVGFLSAKRESKILAAFGGLLAAALILYQEYFLLLVPVLALSSVSWAATPDLTEQRGLMTTTRDALARTLEFVRSALRAPGKQRESCVRYLLWCLAATVTGLALSFLYNKLRFGSYFEDGKMRLSLLRGYPVFGNPLSGLATLLLSPGKSVFLYSPPIILSIIGARHLRRRQPKLVVVMVGTSIVLLSLLSCIAFAGGDWCWGPRYLVVLLPLWALASPFVSVNRRGRHHWVVLAAVSLGFIVQVGALSVENQRFFFERKLQDFFWAGDSWFYFKHSALFSRIGEVLSLKDGPPVSAQVFNSIPLPDWCTYTIMGPPPKMSREHSPTWMRSFKIFYLPRPWPFWMQSIEPYLRPINLRAWLWSLIATDLLGLLLISPLIFTGATTRITKYRAEGVRAV
jgi:hypothetical protein